MAQFSEQLERVDRLLREDPIEAFKLAQCLIDPPPADPCEHAQALDRYATACRVFGDLERSDDSYNAAKALCGCEVCLWDRLRRMIYLRIKQGLQKEAHELTEQALAAAPNSSMKGRCRVAATYAQVARGEYPAAIESARQAIDELDRSDLLYTISAATTIGVCAIRMNAVPESLLSDARNELRELRRGWPRNQRYRSARGKVSTVIALLGYRLGEVDPCELRETLARVQRLHVSLGLWRDAVQIIAESAEICAGMQREDLVARMILAMLDVLPKSLPRHVATALRRLKRSLQAIDRSEVLQAADAVRAAIALRPSPVL